MFRELQVNRHFQWTVDTVPMEIGQLVRLNVEEELRQDLEPAQTLLLQTEELTVLETALKLETAIRMPAVSQVSPQT